MYSICFLLVCSSVQLTVCMAADEHRLDKFEETFSDEIVLQVLEYYLLQKSLGNNDIFKYFIEMRKVIKSVRGVDHRFNAFTKQLVQYAKRIAKKRFAAELSTNDQSVLRKKLIAAFARARANKKLDEKLEEDKLAFEAAVLIVAGVDHNNITVECDGPVHQLKVPLLNFIARTNVLVKLIPLLSIYRMNINDQDIINNTALHYAVELCHDDVVQKICECGGDVTIMGYEDKTVLQKAMYGLTKAQNEKQADLEIRFLRIMKILIEYGTIAYKKLGSINKLDQAIAVFLVNSKGADLHVSL